MSGKSRNTQWQELWLQDFDEDVRQSLKKAHNPHEFISILARILKEKDIHIAHLQRLSCEILQTLEEVFSADAKNRYRLLFEADSTQEKESSKQLTLRWKRFRETNIHSGFVRKIAHLMANLLREKKDRKALEIATELDRVPAYFVDAQHMNEIQELLSPSYVSKERCLAIFMLQGLRVFGVYNEAEVRGVRQKAIEVFQKKCFEVFSHHVLLAQDQKGFAFLFENILPSELAKQADSLVRDFALQKFSYHKNLFSCDFKVEVIEDKSVVSFEKLKLLFKQKLSEISIPHIRTI